jgi:4-hydroxymandelate oxidase
MIVSMASTTPIEDIAKAAAGPVVPQLWLQLYMQPDLEFIKALVHRAGGQRRLTGVRSPGA